MEKQKVVMLGTSKYSFTDKESGRLVEGCSVHYLDVDRSFQGGDKAGYQPLKTTLDISLFDKYKHYQFPLFANCDIDINFNAKKPYLKILGFEPLETIPFVEE